MDGAADLGGNVRPAPLPKIVASHASVAHQGQVAPKMHRGAQDAFASPPRRHQIKIASNYSDIGGKLNSLSTGFLDMRAAGRHFLGESLHKLRPRREWGRVLAAAQALEQLI